MILISGATGTIGGELLRHFLNAGIPARALLRRPPAETSPLPSGILYAIGDLSQPPTLPAALRGIEKLFLLSAVGDHQAELETNIIEAAARSGVASVVKISVMGAALDAPFTFGTLHARLEQKLQDSGMAWTILRPNMLMQNLRWYKQAMAQGVLPLPLGHAAVSHIDASDVAASAFCVLTGDGHAGRTYTLTGPQALTSEEVASLIGVAAARPIRSQPLTLSEFRGFLEKNGESPTVMDAECDLFEAWSQGAGSTVTGDVATLTKGPPETLAGFAARHIAELV